MWAWFKKNILRIKEKKSDPVAPVVVPPLEPIPEIPTPEEVESFPILLPDFYFVDSSHHHPDFDPVRYAAAFPPGRAFLSNKCTQGTTFIDKTHAKRKQLCAENGIEYGGYHFYECKRNPIEQAQFYVKNHGEFTSLPQVDYETTTGQTEDMLIAHKENLWLFLQEVERLTGKKCIIYVNYGAAGRMKFSEKFGKYFVWFARYNSFLGPIPLPWTEKTTAFWQFTETDKFAGFVGGNDVNVYYGKVNALGLK